MLINKSRKYFAVNIHLKKQFRIKKLPDPIGMREPASKNYADKNINDPSVIKNTARVDLNDKILDKITFMKVSSMPAVAEHLIAT